MKDEMIRLKEHEDIGANLRIMGNGLILSERIKKLDKETLEIVISELQTEADRLERVIKGLEKSVLVPLSVEDKKRLIGKQEQEEEREEEEWL